jgi:hypothetical protein
MVSDFSLFFSEFCELGCLAEGQTQRPKARIKESVQESKLVLGFERLCGFLGF